MLLSANEYSCLNHDCTSLFVGNEYVNVLLCPLYRAAPNCLLGKIKACHNTCLQG